MHPDEWLLEMDRMLDAFASQASTSLKIIDQNFKATGRHIDDDFRKLFLDMSNRR